MRRAKKEFTALLLCLALAASCMGCGGGRKEEAREVCEDFFDAYVSCDGEELAEKMEGLEESVPFGGLQQQMAEGMDFETKKVKSEGDTMLVSAVITSVDLRRVLESLPETVDSIEAAKEALAEAFAERDVPLREFEVDVVLVQEDDEWVVQMTPGLADALLGGYYSMIEELAEEADL